MNEEWEFFNVLETVAYSQILGKAIGNSDHLIEGFLYESVRNKGHINLAIFPKNMLITSYIKLNPTNEEKIILDKIGDVKSKFKGKLPVPS